MNPSLVAAIQTGFIVPLMSTGVLQVAPRSCDSLKPTWTWQVSNSQNVEDM